MARGSESKRPADHVEGLEASESKKAKLSDKDSTSALATDEIVAEEAEGVSAKTPQPPQATQTKKGVDVHFKENPYTFLEPDDPVVKTCM